MKHFSHPHALKDLVQKEGNEDEIICSGCEKHLTSDKPSYTCPKRDCEFFLHKSCFELPKTNNIKSHPKHPLTLQPEPPEFSIYYDCNACGELIKAFSFYCEECDFKLHVKCAYLPETVDCKAHINHALSVRHVTPRSKEDRLILCDVCEECVSDAYWSYYCKDCEFCTHMECAFADVAPKEEEVKEEEEEDEEGLSDAARLVRANIKAMDQMARLQFQMNMAQMNARTVANLFRSNY